MGGAVVFFYEPGIAPRQAFFSFELRLSILHVACIMLGGMAQSHAVGGGAGDKPIFWMSVFRYCRTALAALSLSKDP